MTQIFRVTQTGEHFFAVDELIAPTGRTTPDKALTEYKRQSDGLTQWLLPEEAELAKVAIFAPVKTKPTKNLSVKPVDTKQKTLYAVIQNGKFVYVGIKRKDARDIKTKLGGLKAGVTIITYKPENEIR